MMASGNGTSIIGSVLEHLKVLLPWLLTRQMQHSWLVFSLGMSGGATLFLNISTDCIQTCNDMPRRWRTSSSSWRTGACPPSARRSASPSACRPHCRRRSASSSGRPARCPPPTQARSRQPCMPIAHDESAKKAPRTFGSIFLYHRIHPVRYCEYSETWECWEHR